MTTPQLPQYPKVLCVGSYASGAPPRIVEYAYYALLVYSMLAPGLGILVPMLASGLLLVLAAFCIIRLGSRAQTAVYAPLRLAFAWALAYLVVQMTAHDASIMDGRDIITWLLALIIIQSLCLRQGLLHRYVFVLFGIGCSMIPYLTFKGSATQGREQVVVSSIVTGDFTNSNGLAAWFGFCCLYFTIVSIETKRNGVRVASILAALGCLCIVGLTVSRGALLAIGIGITIALRRPLMRGFAPLLVLNILIGITYISGVFDSMLSHYTTRGMEETGRMLVWPLAIERFLNSPLLGVGAANIATYVPSAQMKFTPHNGFILVALSSGVLPFVLFVAWWIRAAQNAYSYDERLADSPFRLPLLVYTFVLTMLGSFAFTAPWGVISCAVAMAPSTPPRVRRLVVNRLEKASPDSTIWTPP